MRLIVSFDTNYELVINLRNNDFVRRWVDLLEEELSRITVIQEDTYSCFYTEKQSRDALIAAIKIVNKFTKREFITVPRDEDFDNPNFYNELHIKFEQLCGPDYDTPTRFMVLGPESLKTAIRQINRFCHRLERRPYKVNLPMIVEFLRPKREKLLLEDYDLFEEYCGKNVVLLDYSTLGKTLYDCFVDGLNPFYAGMKVQHHYNPNFIICFEKEPIANKKEFINWLKEYQIEYVPKQELGVIVLGEFSDNNAEDMIRKTTRITNIKIERDNNG